MTTAATRRKASRQDWFLIALMLSGSFIASLNQMIISPALPRIMHDLHIDAATGQWLTTIFLLVNGVMIPVTAYLISRFTTRTLFLSAMALFTLGTLGCGLAESFTLLMIGRILQAISVGILMPVNTHAIMVIFPLEQRGSALGILGLVMGTAPAIGPTLAGWIIDVWGWNTVFLALLPFALIDIILAAIYMRNLGQTSRPRLDVPSVFLSSIGFGGLLYGFSIVSSAGWGAPSTWGSISVGVGAMVLLIRRLRRVAEPLINLEVFRYKPFTYGTILGMLLNASFIAGGIITPIYLQQVLGYSAMHSGLVMLPAAIAMSLISPFVGGVFDRRGPLYLTLIGTSMVTIGSLLYATFNEHSSFLYLSCVYTFRMAGIAITMMPINTWALNALPTALIAHGNAANNTLRQVAASIGTALMITVMTLVTKSSIHLGFPADFLQGMQSAFLLGGVISALAFVIAARVMRRTK